MPAIESVLLGGAVLLVLMLLVRLYVLVHRLEGSFAKLGYVIREDAKKYFDEAAEKIVDTNEELQSSHTKIVHDGTAAALSEAGAVFEQSLAKAQQDAGDVVLRAREDAQKIITSAHAEAADISDRMLGKTADTIRWVMERYVSKEFSVEQHYDIINTLLDEYINEHRA